MPRDEDCFHLRRLDMEWQNEVKHAILPIHYDCVVSRLTNN